MHQLRVPDDPISANSSDSASFTYTTPPKMFRRRRSLWRRSGAKRRQKANDMIRSYTLTLAVLVVAGSLTWGHAAALRRTISLDGNWQIAEGGREVIPSEFSRTVPVPGLVDMATPPFVAPGPAVADRQELGQKDPRRDAYWYRRTFKVTGPIPEVATLKVAKAMFGTRVFLNGQSLGDHAPCWTPGFFDVKTALKTGENELIIRVGADRDAIRPTYPDGFDFEKVRYIPGIFDSVTLLLSSAPRIENVQVAPDLGSQQAKVRVYLDGTKATRVTVEVRETKSRRLAGQAAAESPAGLRELDVTVPIAGCRLWSPEDPFLYSITVRTSGDEFKTRFGMREFHFDPVTRRGVLNGKPYFLRGSNFTLYRFFEDAERGTLPWNDAWVRRLHRRVKDMHWNSLRYCIGLPPERWYEIADEEGILIQNEFPIWFGGLVPAGLSTEELAREYRDWLQDQWNHPSVVIWDACNETRDPKTGDAFMQIRHLDLSNRPWDDGYSWPRTPGDTSEQHPYQFNAGFRPAQLTWLDTNPEAYQNGGGDGQHAIINNEYGWHWVNRNGTPTTLTRALYDGVLGAHATPQQRLHLQATWLAATTEFWRAHRQCAAVLHFVTLGYARADGQTSDHWLEGKVAKLQWEPEFYRYVRDAFAPVGLMVNFGNERVQPGANLPVPILLINDLEPAWKGVVTLRVKRGNRTLSRQQQKAAIEPWGTAKLSFDINWPTEEGLITLEAELRGADGRPVRSSREVTVSSQRGSLLEDCTVSASSVYQPAHSPAYAVDGYEDSYWSSAFQDDAWLAVAFNAPRKISQVNIIWEKAYATAFSVAVSPDGQTWTEVYQTSEGQGGTNRISFPLVEVQQLRVNCTKRGTPWGNAIRELQVAP